MSENQIVVRVNKEMTIEDLVKIETQMREAGATQKAIENTISEMNSIEILTTEFFIDTEIGGIVKRISS